LSAVLVVCALREELGGFEPPPGVTVLTAGVGLVEAAVATATALARGGVALAISAGIGGGFAGRARVGDALAIDAETLVDLGREDGSPLALPGGAALARRALADPRLVALARGAGLRVAGALTRATVTTDAATAAALAARVPGAAVESMEGFAVLRAAERAGVAAAEVRGISNLVGPRETAGWDFRAGSAAAVAALESLLRVLGTTLR